MKQILTKAGLTTLLMVVAGLFTMAGSTQAQQPGEDYDLVAKIDRFLDAEVWTDHSDGDYYEGDNIVIHFRVSRDAFVAIYSIDSRGQVKLLFPAEPGQDNFIYGGITYSLPDSDDDFDLVVTGPEGLEHIQMIASPERFPIPNWYHNSGIVFEGDDRYDYMDYLNNTHFVRYSGQRFAYDRAVVFVNEWEEYYYRPVYYHHYPSWSVYGNMYIDYPWGGTVYIDGIYWGVAPLYVPRILVGWHTFTVYDHYGYCWETDFHASRYNTVVFDHTIIKTRATVTSKYASVHTLGYRDPIKNGYPAFKTKSVRLSEPAPGTKTGVSATKTTRGKTASASSTGDEFVSNKKYVRGSTKLAKTSRGYEIDGASASYKSTKATASRQGGNYSNTGKPDISSRKSSSTSTPAGESSGYYQKKSGSSAQGWSGSSKSSVKSKSATKSSTGRVKSQTSKTPTKAGKASGSKVNQGDKSSGGSVKKSSGKVEQKKADPKPSGTVKPSSSPQKSGSAAGSSGSSKSSKSGGKVGKSGGSSKKDR